MGYIVRGPMGGMTWHHLQYVLGLRQLGHDVFFVEDSGDSEYACYDPVRNVNDRHPGYGLAYARNVFEKVGMSDRWGYYDKHSDRWWGGAPSAVVRTWQEADLLINLSCSNVLRPWAMGIPCRAIVDTDPLFTQIRNREAPDRMEWMRQHTVHFTYGEHILQRDCQIPYDGITWEPTRQPIVLAYWPITPGQPNGKYTTVMKWESYPAKYFGGSRYGMKAASFAAFMSLPEMTPAPMELAVSDDAAPREQLRANGWVLSDPTRRASDPWSYQSYIQQSKAEFSLAKHGYVTGRTGWFSDRSAAYLASGRPVLLQDTGYSNYIETGRGLMAFHTPEEAVQAIELIDRSYAMHCAAARDIAHTYFSAQKILRSLIDHACCKVY